MPVRHGPSMTYVQAGPVCKCKMEIHPSQIGVIHEVMTPSAAQIAWAREVLEAMEAAAREGRGAVKDKNGEMIDLMHIKVPNKLLALR